MAVSLPLGLNKYAYVQDNPETYVDPNGHVYIPPPVSDASKRSIPSTGLSQFVVWVVKHHAASIVNLFASYVVSFAAGLWGTIVNAVGFAVALTDAISASSALVTDFQNVFADYSQGNYAAMAAAIGTATVDSFIALWTWGGLELKFGLVASLGLQAVSDFLTGGLLAISNTITTIGSLVLQTVALLGTLYVQWVETS